MADEKIRDAEILEMIKIVAPGTPLREGLEYIQKARTGALIVVGDSELVLNIVDGGFLLNKDFSPSYLYELAKMDGAIILSKDLKKIIYANAQLIPDTKISTVETGSRHRTAERVAKQTGELVICISQRRNVITLYKKHYRYFLGETSEILSRANQALQTLEKYRNVLDIALANLSINEFNDTVTLEQVAIVIQRMEMVMRIIDEVRKYIVELGNEGRLVTMQLEELVGNTEKDALLILEDYIINDGSRTVESVMKQIRSLSDEELIDINLICKALGYHDSLRSLEMNVSSRGYRIMSKLPKLTITIIKNLIDRFNNLQGILGASIDELDDVEGIGEVRARAIKEGLRKTFDMINIGLKTYRGTDYLTDFPGQFVSRRH